MRNLTRSSIILSCIFKIKLCISSITFFLLDSIRHSNSALNKSIKSRAEARDSIQKMFIPITIRMSTHLASHTGKVFWDIISSKVFKAKKWFFRGNITRFHLPLYLSKFITKLLRLSESCVPPRTLCFLNNFSTEINQIDQSVMKQWLFLDILSVDIINRSIYYQ